MISCKARRRDARAGRIMAVPASLTKTPEPIGAPPGQALLEVDGVTLQYKTRDHLVTATYRVGFQVYPADRFVLLGPSGCGKSTLLKGVAGFMRPVEGTIK